MVLIESKNKIGHSNMFIVPHADFKSVHLLHEMAKEYIFNATSVLQRFYLKNPIFLHWQISVRFSS